MKNTAALMGFFIFTASVLNAQKIGINKTSPLYSVDIVQPDGLNLPSSVPVLNVSYSGTNFNDVIGIKSKCKPADYYGIGGSFEGGYIGIDSKVEGNTAPANFFSIRSNATGAGSGNYYGIYSKATSTSGINVGVYGFASSGTTNWAGYFEGGNVFIKNRLGINNENPLHPVHINQPSGTTLTAGNPVMHVEYTGTNAADVIGIRAKCVLPSSYGIGGEFEGGSTGVVGKVISNSNSLHYGVQGIATSNDGNGLNVGLYGSASGGLVNLGAYIEDGNVVINDKLGIGRDDLTNRLEVNGNASKSTAGDWLANSDARLKKNIVPLDAQEMIEKLLVLKGITYEWNDDTTGNERPTGIQYGFTAQNIREVFPSLVSEDGNGFLQTAYGTYDAMMVEALRYLYMENQSLKHDLVNQSSKNDLEIQTLKNDLVNQSDNYLQEIQSLRNEVEAIRDLIREVAVK